MDAALVAAAADETWGLKMPRRTRRQLEQYVRHFLENGLKFLLQYPANLRDLLEILEFDAVDLLDFSKMKAQAEGTIP